VVVLTIPDRSDCVKVVALQSLFSALFKSHCKEICFFIIQKCKCKVLFFGVIMSNVSPTEVASSLAILGALKNSLEGTIQGRKVVFYRKKDAGGDFLELKFWHKFTLWQKIRYWFGSSDFSLKTVCGLVNAAVKKDPKILDSMYVKKGVHALNNIIENYNKNVRKINRLAQKVFNLQMLEEISFPPEKVAETSTLSATIKSVDIEEEEGVESESLERSEVEIGGREPDQQIVTERQEVSELSVEQQKTTVRTEVQSKAQSLQEQVECLQPISSGKISGISNPGFHCYFNSLVKILWASKGFRECLGNRNVWVIDRIVSRLRHCNRSFPS